jgi:hypothetical protein
MGVARDMGGDEALAAEAYYQGLLQASGCNAETDVLNALFGDEICCARTSSASNARVI